MLVRSGSDIDVVESSITSIYFEVHITRRFWEACPAIPSPGRRTMSLISGNKLTMLTATKPPLPINYPQSPANEFYGLLGYQVQPIVGSQLSGYLVELGCLTLFRLCFVQKPSLRQGQGCLGSAPFKNAWQEIQMGADAGTPATVAVIYETFRRHTPSGMLAFFEAADSIWHTGDFS